jgi:hypothetical protein
VHGKLFPTHATVFLSNENILLVEERGWDGEVNDLRENSRKLLVRLDFKCFVFLSTIFCLFQSLTLIIFNLDSF